MNIYNFCDLLKNDFGKFYENITLENIDGIKTPVYFSGTDYFSLHPKDTICMISYIRQSSPDSTVMIDLGGCDKKPFIVNNLRFVCYSKEKFNEFAKFQLFVKAMEGLNINITQVDSDFTSVYNTECGKNKNVKIKGGSYLAINFTLRKKVDICEIKEC